MRVYDYFRGTCPNCNGQIDRDHLNIKQDSIQTSLFSIKEIEQSFRSFYPDDKVPEDMGKCSIKIGKSVCCDTQLEAVFDGNKLLGYKMLDKDFDFELYDYSDIPALCEAP